MREITKYKNLIFLLIIFSIFAFLNILTIRNYRYIKGIDTPNHMFFCLQFYHKLNIILAETKMNFYHKISKIKDIFQHGIIYWPKTVYLTTLPFLKVFGISLESIKYSNLLFLFILIVAVYLLTLEITQKKSKAIFASFIVGTYPLIFESSRQYGLDFPLTAWVSLTFLWLYKIRFFDNIGLSIIFAIILGIGMLLKGQFLLFVGFPFLGYLYFSLREALLRKKKTVLLKKVFIIITVMIIASALSAIWWGNKMKTLFWGLKEHIFSQNKTRESIPLVTPNSIFYWLFYPREIYQRGLGPLITILTLLSFIYFIICKKCKEKTLIISWIIFPLILFSTIFKVRQLRFIMPIFPAFAIVTAHLLDIRKRWLRYLIVTAMLSSLLVQYIYLTFPPKSKNKIGKLMGGTIYGHNYTFNYVSLEYKIAKKTIDYLRKGEKEYLPLNIISLIPLSPMELQFWLFLFGLKNNIFLDIAEIFEQYAKFFSRFSPILLCLFPNKDIDWPFDKRFFKYLKQYNFHYPEIIKRSDWKENLYKLNEYKKKLQLKECFFINGNYLLIYTRR